MDDYPIIALPGSEGWTSAYEMGGLLDEKFPKQDASQLAYAMEYNGFGPVAEHKIIDIVMVCQGEHDGDEWVWIVSLDNGDTWTATGGCDYTGWDCQSHLEWTPNGTSAF